MKIVISDIQYHASDKLSFYITEEQALRLVMCVLDASLNQNGFIGSFKLDK